MTSEISEAHRAVIAHVGSSLRVERSELKPMLSMHVMPDSLPLSHLFTFQKIATSCGKAGMSAMGTVDGKISFSINARPRPPPAPSRKRNRDTSREEAERACARVKKCGERAERVPEETYDAAKDVLTEIIKLRGTSGEQLVESWGLSLRTGGQWGAPADKDSPPNLVISARLSAGVAVGIRDVVAAVAPCKDGLLTVNGDSVNSDFRLPQTEQSITAESGGQRSLMLLASVPVSKK